MTLSIPTRNSFVETAVTIRPTQTSIKRLLVFESTIITWSMLILFESKEKRLFKNRNQYHSSYNSFSNKIIPRVMTMFIQVSFGDNTAASKWGSSIMVSGQISSQSVPIKFRFMHLIVLIVLIISYFLTKTEATIQRCS